ncbi:MAG TPA: Chromate resistance protein ChrB [Tepidiformaceae bacterium]|jgi:hypothetical protein
MSDWLLISYHVPTNPSALRVATWRALKQRGAVTLGDGLYALPATPGHREALLQIADRIADGGGTAISLNASALTAADERALQHRFEAARRDEYLQVQKSARKLVDHIGREEQSHDYRFAEVESLEEELNKVRRQFERVVERDSGDPPVREEARAAVTAAEERLQLYLDNAYREENRE